MSTTGQGKERRTQDRLSTEELSSRIEVRFEKAEHAARALRAYSLNLSVGGLCLQTERVYERGERLHLWLTVDGEDFDLQGEVAWTRGQAVGVRFVEVPGPDQDRLKRLVASIRRSGAELV